MRPTNVPRARYRPLPATPPPEELFGTAAVARLRDAGPAAAAGAPLPDLIVRGLVDVSGGGCGGGFSVGGCPRRSAPPPPPPGGGFARGDPLCAAAAAAAAAPTVPAEYLGAADADADGAGGGAAGNGAGAPGSVLVVGWGPDAFMENLLRRLDAGSAALPPGSEVVFANAWAEADSLGRVLARPASGGGGDESADGTTGERRSGGGGGVRLEAIRARHVRADPLQRTQLAAALDVSRFRWGHGAGGGKVGRVLCDSDALR